MIVNSIIVINRPDSPTTIKIRIIHTDHLGNEYPDNIRGIDNTIDQVGLDLLVSENAARQNLQLSENEVQQWIQEIEAGRDPAHVDMGGYFENSVPEFNTWAAALNSSIVPFLQTEQPVHTQELVKIADLWSRLTNKEGEDIAGKPNDVAAEIQVAINAQAVNESYIPLINSEGLPRA